MKMINNDIKVTFYYKKVGDIYQIFKRIEQPRIVKKYLFDVDSIEEANEVIEDLQIDNDDKLYGDMGGYA